MGRLFSLVLAVACTGCIGRSAMPRTGLDVGAAQVVEEYEGSFSVYVPIEGDADGDAQALLYWCNETRVPGCAPLDNEGLPMLRLFAAFYVLVTDADYIAGDQLRLRIVTTDSTGVGEQSPEEVVQVGPTPPAACEGLGRATLYDEAGSGALTDPFRICTAQQWIDLGERSTDWDKHFLLGDDIDLRDVPGPALEIGTDADPFTGSLDGGGNTITGFAKAGGADVGLFGWISTAGVALRDLGLIDANVSGTRQIGALIGTLEAGSVERVWATGFVTATNSHTGGLIGHTDAGTTVSDSWSDVTLVSTGGASIGGLIGHNESTVRRCYAIGSVDAGGDRTGGLIGWGTNGGTAIDSFAANAVTGSGNIDATGALVGTGPVTNSYFDAAQACANGTFLCGGGGTAITSAGYFFDPTSPPLDTWDFVSVWQAVPGGFPQLRR